MSTIDWSPILQAVMAVIASVITGLIAIFVPRAIAAIEARTKVQITDQERQAVFAALQTAAGIIKTKLDQGVLKIGDITPGNPAVVAQAQAALARVPDSAAAQGTTPVSAAEIIVGRVNTSPVLPVIVVPPVKPV